MKTTTVMVDVKMANGYQWAVNHGLQLVETRTINNTHHGNVVDGVTTVGSYRETQEGFQIELNENYFTFSVHKPAGPRKALWTVIFWFLLIVSVVAAGVGIVKFFQDVPNAGVYFLVGMASTCFGGLLIVFNDRFVDPAIKAM